jgi:hypothetical protein
VSIHAEWDVASSCGVEVVGAGCVIGDGKVGDTAVVLGGDGGGCLVVEGTPADVVQFAERVLSTVRRDVPGAEPVRSVSSPDGHAGLPAAADFVLQHATGDDLDRIADLVRNRRIVLRETASAGVAIDSVVELAGLSPQYFNQLRGTVTEFSGGRGQARVTVRLDKSSVTTLATRSNKFAHLLGQDSYDLRGVPKAHCRLITD